MSRLVGWKACAALLALLVAVPLLPAAPVPPGKTPLSQVPEQAPLVVYLHGVERTLGRFVTTLKAGLPELAPPVEKQIDDFLKNGSEGRKLAGLEKDGSVFLAFLEMPRGFQKVPKAAFIVAVSDYAKFRDGVLDADQKTGLKKWQNGVEEAPVLGGDAMYLLDRKGWAIVATDKETIELFTKEYKGLDTRMSKEQAAKLLDGDVGLYLSMDHFNKDYAEQIKEAKSAVNDQIIPQLETTGQFDKATMKIYKTMIASAFQAVDDSRGLLLTVDFRPGGLALHVETEVRPDTATSTNLKVFQTSPFTDLSQLPTGLAYYTGVKPTPQLLESIGPLVFGVQGDPGNEDTKPIKAALEKIVKAGPTDQIGSMTVPLSGLQAIKYKDAALGLEGNLDLLRALTPNTGFQGTVLKEKATVKLKAQQHRGMDFHAIVLALDLEKTVERAGMKDAPEETKKAFMELYKKMMGEKINAWLGTDGKTVLQVIAPDWKSAQKLLDAYSSGKGTLADDAGFKEVRKELPADTTLYGAMDPVLYGSMMVDAFRIGFQGAAQGAFQFPPNFPAKPAQHVPSYFGMAVTLKQDRGSLDIFLSAKAVNDAYKAFGAPFLGR